MWAGAERNGVGVGDGTVDIVFHIPEKGHGGDGVGGGDERRKEGW